MAAGEQLIDAATVDRIRRGWTSNEGSDPRLRLLSPQERRILDHVAEGLTNRQIGEAMSLAEKTVKNYITAVLGKLGMERRTQAAVFAVTHKDRQGRPAVPPPSGRTTERWEMPAEPVAACRRLLCWSGMASGTMASCKR